MENNHKELQLLPIPYTTPSYSQWSSNLITNFRSDHLQHPLNGGVGPSLDLELSSTLRPIKPFVGTEMRKWRATDQIRIAAMESAYVKRVMDMTRREMEMAQSDFARARHLWEMAHEEVERAEKMKERATRRVDSCMEITCQACRRKFRPY